MRQNSSGKVFGSGLAGASRDCHHREGKKASIVSRRILKGFQGVFYQHCRPVWIVGEIEELVPADLAAGAAWWQARGDDTDDTSVQFDIRNPFRLMEALRFGLLLVAILVLSRLLVDSVGDEGIYYLAAASGVADVDAITLSLSRMSLNDLPMPVVSLGILLAAAVNGVAKSIISAVAGGSAIGWRVAAGLIIPIAVATGWLLAQRVS